MDRPTFDTFAALATEVADGEKWKLLRADGWEDFQERLARVVGELPVRRRQALMMLLFSLVEEVVAPGEVAQWAEGRDLDADEGVEDLIAYLRRRRAPAG